MEPAGLPQQLQIDGAVRVGFQDEAAGVSTLGDVMRRADCNNAGQASHR
jgi:hypothetical protein